MAIITSYGRETTRVTVDSSLVSDKRTRSLMDDDETSYGRETTRLAADSSLVNDKKTCSLVNDNENMPTRVNRCDIVSACGLPEIFHARIDVFGDLCEANVWQLLPPTGVKLPGWLRTAAW